MDLLLKLLPTISKGHVTSKFGPCVLRIGDRYSVGETVSIRTATLTLEEAAAAVLDCRK